MSNKQPVFTDGVLSFAILSNGKEIDSSLAIVSIVVESTANKSSRATIVLRCELGLGLPFKLSDVETFKPGSMLEVKLGYNSKNESVFKGEVVKHRAKTEQDLAFLHVECEGERIKLSGNEQQTTWALEFGRELHDLDLEISRSADGKPGDQLSGWVHCPMFIAQPGDRVELSGLSQRFDRTESILGVRYELKSGEGSTALQIGLTDAETAPSPLRTDLEKLQLMENEDNTRFLAGAMEELNRTKLEWDDLVLPSDSMQQIREIEHWLTHKETLMKDWGMERKIKPGYRALFHGSSGTGKTLAASLLGKYTARKVYRIDLSTVISKYIGETEKNLSAIFDKAENQNWILFFDEADALFGKRSNVRDAHDKYANQEVSYLMSHAARYDGLVIVALDEIKNIDEDFGRLFQSLVRFPLRDR